MCAALLAVLAANQPVALAQNECLGDCNSDGKVAINELILLVNIALGSAEVSACLPGQCQGEISDIV